MQISLNWINELVEIETEQLDDLVEKLTLGGFEVEEILEIDVDNQKQTVLDISATANRSDSLSAQGISAEIAALLNKPTRNFISLEKYGNLNENINNCTQIIPTNPDYSTFLAVTLKNVTNLTVPKWITDKILTSGFTPSNNLLDFQTYILLETGYPFEFYDLDKIYSKINCSKFDLRISKAEIDENFCASNENIYKLNPSILLVKANQTPLSIAGIIANSDFSYSENTKSLLIEGSIFNAATIRQQSRNLGLRTDRSARYEKSLKKVYLVESLSRLISLLEISNPDLNWEVHTNLQISEPILEPILLKYENINEILGPIKQNVDTLTKYISPQNISSYLERLNFEFLYDDINSSWQVQIPDSRIDDITREIDLIEEIGRLHGFNNFLTTLPKIKTIGKEDLSYSTRKKVTSCLLNLGFNELIHYSLVNQSTFLSNKVKLVNPLLSDYSTLRSSLLPSLIKTVQENLKQGNSFVEGFEYGHIFASDLTTKFKETEYVAGIFGGLKTKSTWFDSANSLTWFEAKGKIEQLFKQLNVPIFWKDYLENYTENILHPFRSTNVCASNGEKIGIFGQINPILASELSISSDLYLFEFNIELLEQMLHINKLAIYQEYSIYPKIIKDLSFIIKKDISFTKIQQTIYCNGTKFLSEINLLDEYRGDSIPDDCTSLCLQLIFQSEEKTLQNKEIENIIKKLQLILNQKFDALVRD